MVFEGRYLQGKRNGEAFIEFQDQTKITANYTDDIASGLSNFISKDGQTYQLKIGKELLYGFVSIKFTDQADFAGTYLEGLRNGEGVFRYPDGSEYKGTFKDDQRNGLSLIHI